MCCSFPRDQSVIEPGGTVGACHRYLGGAAVNFCGFFYFPGFFQQASARLLTEEQSFLIVFPTLCVHGVYHHRFSNNSSSTICS